MEISWSSVSTALFFGFLTLIFYEMYRYFSIQSRFPPGPKPWPLIGNLPQLMKDPFPFIHQMKSYGDISTFYLGRTPHIMLNKLQIAKEALVQHGSVYSGRPYIPTIDWILNGEGLAFSTGHLWKQQRKFSSLTLKNFGFGKKSLEERVQVEATYLTEELLKNGETPVNPHFILMNGVANVICSIVFGDRFEYSNNRFHHLLELINDNVQLVGSAIGPIVNIFPFLKHFPGPQQRIYNNADDVKTFIREEAREHAKTLDRDNLRDFIDAYIIEMERQQSSPDSTFHESGLVATVADLFLAGTDTTTTTLRWGILFMMKYPDIQEKCHKEIVGHLGFDRIPSMDDRGDLPYVYATVHEIQRVSNLVPLSLIHCTTQDTSLRGFHLPKGTNVFPNLMAILTDEDHWKFPNSFNPHNFLDEEGQFHRNESFLPFSLGQRVCLGEQLARMELFIIFTALLQRISFSCLPGAPPPDLEGIFGIIHSPKPFTVLCCSREASA